MYLPTDDFRQRVAQIESGNNPLAENPNSSAKGLFQFTDKTAKKYKLDDPFDREKSTQAFDRLTSDNYAVLRRRLQREPTEAELYLAHQQGAGGAIKLLTNPNARAVDVVGKDAVKLNGGNEQMTAADFANKWISKYDGTKVDTVGAIQQGIASAQERKPEGVQVADSGYGNRIDGTPKGAGYFGELKRPDGDISTELSVGIEIDGKETQIPLLVPTLNKDEIKWLLNNPPTPNPPKSIMEKAVKHAMRRINEGKSPFADSGQIQSDAIPKLDIMLELEKRGALPPEKAEIIGELRRRGVIGGQAEKPEENKGFFERVGDDYQKRSQYIDESRDLYNQGKQGLGSMALQQVGSSFGLLNDVIGEGFQSAGSALSSITPDFIEEPVKEAGKSVLNSIGDTRLGNTAQGALSELAAARQYMEQNHPVAMRNIDSAANIGSGLAATGILKNSAPAVTDVASKTTKRAATGIANKTARTLAPTIDDASLPLVKRAKEFGIPLRLDQVSPTRARNTLQKVSQEVPFSGVDAFEATQRKAFTRAVAKTIGLETDDLSPKAIAKFRKANSAAFEKLVGKGEIPVDVNDVHKISMLRKTVDSTTGITSRDAKILKSEIEKISTELSENFVSGKKIAAIRSDLLKKSTSSSVGKSIFSDLIEQIDGITKKSLSPENVAELDKARREWRNFKTIQSLLKRSTDGQIDPTKLLDKVSSNKFISAESLAVGDDELVDLARIGKQFLPKKGGSDTVQKAALGVSGTGIIGTTLINPALGAGLAVKAGAGIGANRLYQSGINTNQKLIEEAIKKSSSNALQKTPERLIDLVQ